MRVLLPEARDLVAVLLQEDIEDGEVFVLLLIADLLEVPRLGTAARSPGGAELGEDDPAAQVRQLGGFSVERP